MIPINISDHFEYINEMIQYTISDGQITNDEYNEILKYALDNNLTKNQILGKFKNLIFWHKIIVGDKPEIDSGVINFGEFDENQLSEKITIKNNYVFNPLTVIFEDVPYAISVIHSVVIPPLQTQSIVVTFYPGYIDDDIDFKSSMTIVMKSQKRKTKSSIILIAKNKKQKIEKCPSMMKTLIDKLFN